MSEDISIRVMGLRRFVTLCKIAPNRNSLTYLLTCRSFLCLSFMCTFSEINTDDGDDDDDDKQESKSLKAKVNISVI